MEAYTLNIPPIPILEKTNIKSIHYNGELKEILVITKDKKMEIFTGQKAVELFNKLKD